MRMPKFRPRFSLRSLLLLSLLAASGAALWRVREPWGRVFRISDSAVYTALYSPTGKQILTVAESRLAELWNAETGEKIAPLEGRLYELGCTVFSPDGKFVAFGEQLTCTHGCGEFAATGDTVSCCLEDLFGLVLMPLADRGM